MIHVLGYKVSISKSLIGQIFVFKFREKTIAVLMYILDFDETIWVWLKFQSTCNQAQGKNIKHLDFYVKVYYIYSFKVTDWLRIYYVLKFSLIPLQHRSYEISYI